MYHTFSKREDSEFNFLTLWHFDGPGTVLGTHRMSLYGDVTGYIAHVIREDHLCGASVMTGSQACSGNCKQSGKADTGVYILRMMLECQ